MVLPTVGQMLLYQFAIKTIPQASLTREVFHWKFLFRWLWDVMLTGKAKMWYQILFFYYYCGKEEHITRSPLLEMQYSINRKDHAMRLICRTLLSCWTETPYLLNSPLHSQVSRLWQPWLYSSFWLWLWKDHTTLTFAWVFLCSIISSCNLWT